MALPSRLSRKTSKDIQEENTKKTEADLSPVYPKSDFILGVDPGLKGGLAIFDCNKEKFVLAMPTPIHPDIASKSGKYTYFIKLIDSTIAEFVAKSPESAQWMCCLERQQAMPQQGVVSMLTTGYGYGVWRALCTLLASSPDRLIIVRSLEWQVLLRGESAKDETKAKSIARVSRLFPDVDLQPGRRRTPSDGIADAVNIAHYAFVRMLKK